MSSTFLIGGVVLGGLHCSVRLGLFGKKIIEINKDDSCEYISRSFFWDTARWNPGDMCVRVHHYSFKPIEFKYTQKYGPGWNNPDFICPKGWGLTDDYECCSDQD
jgi:hypothetical protein